jgi:TusA-related sulfurtransferase
LNLRGVACPLNFVKAKLKLEGLETGQMLAVILDSGEPMENVPASLRNEGQEIVEMTDLGDGHWRVVVRKQYEEAMNRGKNRGLNKNRGILGE